MAALTLGQLEIKIKGTQLYCYITNFTYQEISQINISLIDVISWLVTGEYISDIPYRS